MSFLKRAAKAVRRRWVKSILILVLLFVIANLVLSGFSIQQAVNKAKDSARQQLGATLTLSFDQQAAREKAMLDMQNNKDSSSDNKGKFKMETKPVTEDMAKKVASLQHIVGYNYTVSTSAKAEGFNPVEQDTSDSDTSASTQTDDKRPGGGMMGGQSGGNMIMPDVSLTGVYSSELYSTFSSGSDKLESGKAVLYEEGSNTRPALIEKTLADYNDLKVGDTIKISTLAADDDGNETDGKEYTLTIAGIFSAGSQSGAMGGMNMEFMQTYNQIFVDYKTALEIKENTTASTMGMRTSDGIDSVEYYLDDPKNMDAVIAASKSLDIDWDTFKLDANSAQYESMVGSIDKVGSFATILVIVVAVAGAAILALILAMLVRDRMTETGILLSLGESKWKIAAQYVSEVLIVALIAFTISLASGSAISQKMGDLLLNQSVSSSESGQQSMQGDPGQGQGGPMSGNRGQIFKGQAGLQHVNTIDTLTVQVDSSTIAMLYGFGLLLVLVSTAIPSVLVLRYNPRRIFTRAE